MKLSLKKLTAFFVAFAVMVTFLAPTATLRAFAANDYPYKDNIPNNRSTPDKWGMIVGECTSYCAWCLNSRNNIPFNSRYKGGSFGHAGTWGNAAKNVGIAVDMNPRVGDVAWQTNGDYGHVAYVIAVNGNNVTVEQYAGSTHKFSTTTSDKTSYKGFIHFENNSVKYDNLPAVSGTANISDGRYSLVNVGSGYYMNYSWGTNGSPIVMSKPDNSAEQIFTLENVGGGKYEMHINHADGGVVNVNSNSPAIGDTITRLDDHDNDTQRFYFTPVGNGEYVIRNAANTGALIAAPNTEWHVKLQLAGYKQDNALVRWKLVPLDGQSVEKPLGKEAELPEKFCATISNTEGTYSFSYQDTEVKLAASSDSAYQKWYFTRLENGSYKISAFISGNSLDVIGGSSADSTRVRPFEPNDSAAQKWKIMQYDNGDILLSPECALTKVLDINGGAMADGTPIQIYEPNASAAQRFKINICECPHSFTDEVIDPTCTAAGYTRHTCVYCDEITTDSEVEATGHIFDEGTVVKTATDTEAGIIKYVCEVCGEEKYDIIEPETTPTPTDAEDILLGDVNADGKITVTDLSKVAAHIKTVKMLDEDQQKRADVNTDRKITVTDLSKIAAHVKGIKQLG